MTERERFEAWARAEGYRLTRNCDGDYAYLPTIGVWEAWQAAQARQRRVIERLAGLCIGGHDGVYDHPGSRDQLWATEAEAVAAVIAWAESAASPAASDQPSE